MSAVSIPSIPHGVLEGAHAEDALAFTPNCLTIHNMIAPDLCSIHYHYGSLDRGRNPVRGGKKIRADCWASREYQLIITRTVCQIMQHATATGISRYPCPACLCNIVIDKIDILNYPLVLHLLLHFPKHSTFYTACTTAFASMR